VSENDAERVCGPSDGGCRATHAIWR